MAEVPDLLTVEEAASVLRIGRTLAYQLAQEWIATNGNRGIPCRRVGRLLRVPSRELAEFMGGPITWPPVTPAAMVDDGVVVWGVVRRHVGLLTSSRGAGRRPWPRTASARHRAALLDSVRRDLMWR